MFIDLIETLRCPRPHEDSWLVGAFDQLVERDVRAGRLGCPVCRAEYPIVDGVVWFDGAPGAPESETDASSSSIAPEEVLRLAAMLDLSSPGGVVVLEGEWGRAAPAMAGFVDVTLLLLNPPAGLAEREALSAVVCRDRVPVAESACRAIALRSLDVVERFGESLARSLRPRGRLVVPSGAVIPDGFEEMARDAAWCVAERAAPPPSLVSLERGRGPR